MQDKCRGPSLSLNPTVTSTVLRRTRLPQMPHSKSSTGCWMKLSHIYRHLQCFYPSGFMSAYNSRSRSVAQVDSPVGNDSTCSGCRNRPVFTLFFKTEHLITIQNSHSIWAINGDRVRHSIFYQCRNTIRATDCCHAPSVVIVVSSTFAPTFSVVPVVDSAAPAE